MGDIDLTPVAPPPPNLVLTVRGEEYEFSAQVLHSVGPWIGLLALEDDRVDALLSQMELEIKDANGKVLWPQ